MLRELLRRFWTALAASETNADAAVPPTEMTEEGDQMTEQAGLKPAVPTEWSLDRALDHAPFAIRTYADDLRKCRRLLASDYPLGLRELADIPAYPDQVGALERALTDAARPFLRETEERLRTELLALSDDLSRRIDELADEPNVEKMVIGTPPEAGKEG